MLLLPSLATPTPGHAVPRRRSRRLVPISDHVQPLRHLSPPNRKRPSRFLCFSVQIQEITQLAQNKVLMAAAASAALGQLSKPFTSAGLYGTSLDFMAAARAGGFPSTHSSTVVAAATTLALERGFSDSLVGMAVVYACLVMYDSQGVRREVGKHAKLLNKIPARKPMSGAPARGKNCYVHPEQGLSSLKESVGHSKVEVVAGALLGFFVSLVMHRG